MSRFVTPSDQVGDARTSRRSVYEDRARAAWPWLQVAETHPLTGELEWVPDWGRRVLGWQPVDEFLRS